MQERRAPHRRNERLERLLRELNAALAPAEERVAARYRKPRHPVSFIVGAPRSGTTLLMQWLAATGQFAYPTNLLSRFYAAPHLGARIQQLLTDPDYDFNDELFDLKPGRDYASRLGKTRGALGPNEFWYFWRRFIPNQEPRWLDEAEERSIDGKGLAAGLAALEAVFDKPLALKAFILQYNLEALARCLDGVLFVFVKRQPFYNVQSLLEARVEYFGRRDAWYSVKPREYAELRQRDPFQQVAGQVFHTERAIAACLAEMEPARSLTVGYEDFCRRPGAIYEQWADKLAEQGCRIERRYHGPRSFEPTNVLRVPAQDARAIVDAWREVAGEVIGPESEAAVR